MKRIIAFVFLAALIGCNQLQPQDVGDQPVDLAPTATDYSYVTQWGVEGENPGQFDYPIDVAVDAANNVYVTDWRNNRVQKFDASGTFIDEFGEYGFGGEGRFIQPNGVAIDSAGNIYVVDSSLVLVQKFDADGTFILQWGGFGVTNGRFSSPDDIAIDSNDNVYVADSNNHRVQKFDSSGTFITKWGTQGSRDGQFQYTESVATDSSDNVYVIDRNNSRIQKFDSNGTFITKWGTRGTGNGQFARPYDITVDNDGHVLVTDAGSYATAQIQRVQVFDANGTFFSMFGTAGTGAGQFDSPDGIVADSNNNVYVADTGNNRIQKFAPTAPADTTAPTVTVKEGEPFTVGADGVYRKVSFKLYDAGKIDRLTLNGVEKDLTDNSWSDLNFVTPGTFGAVVGTNELVVYDVAGNATTLTFTLLENTSPTITVKQGETFTVGSGGVYSKVSFKLYDAGKIDKLTLNGKVKDLSNNAWSDLNFVTVGAFGAVSETNELVVYDAVGNTKTLTFTLVSASR